VFTGVNGYIAGSIQLSRCVLVIDRVAEPPITRTSGAFGGVITAASGSAAASEADIAVSRPVADIAAASGAVTTALHQVASEAEWAAEASTVVVEASMVAAASTVVEGSRVVAEAFTVAAASMVVVAAAADAASHELHRSPRLSISLPPPHLSRLLR
jgi:hypothetical protein